MTFYDFTLKDGRGEDYPLEALRGKVVLVVNTATGCGFTPHYKPMEEMYEKYHDRGFEILDIPCNQFAGQTPGTDEEIHEFCTLRYNTKFPQMKKSDVNGENALPLYAWLKERKGFNGFGFGPAAAAMTAMLKGIDKDYKKNPDIKWNFTKFLVDREGNVVERYEPTHSMKNVEKAVEKLL
ncbi:MAG: glutathione peroxidase [Clostridiales bacterium]|nr:glutathione peroxidase [Clostridiales bacterium]